MRNTILALAFAIGTLPAGYAQVQANTTTEHTEEHNATTVNPDGTAVHHAAAVKEKTDSTVNADGSTSTTRTKQTNSRTRVRSEVPPPPPVPVTPPATVEHHSSTTETTTTTQP